MMNAIALRSTLNVKPSVNVCASTANAGDAAKVATCATARPPAIPISEERIRIRAFEIYQARNGGPGDALSDWLQAKRELESAAEVRPPRVSDDGKAQPARRP
jgi:hypothetical protein